MTVLSIIRWQFEGLTHQLLLYQLAVRREDTTLVFMMQEVLEKTAGKHSRPVDYQALVITK